MSNRKDPPINEGPSATLAGNIIPQAPPVGYGKDKNVTDSQRALKVAEYKQLLTLMPEKQLELMNVESKAAYYNDGWNAYADQCRAIIQAKIKETE